MLPSFAIEPLGPHHDRAAFSCGNAYLDDFIRTKARRENELGYGAVFILATGSGSQQIVGYYSLSSHTIALEGIDAASRKKLPRYPLVPTTLIGRLARDLRFRGERVGELLLLDALSRAVQISGQVGSHAVTVDAIDAEAIAFYVKYGFISLIGHPNRLYLPMVSIKKLRL